MARSRSDTVPTATSLAHAPNGEELVARMAAGREWWRLRTGDVAPSIQRLPVAVRTDKYNRLGWLGRQWDGVSDMPIGEAPCDDVSSANSAEPLLEDMDAWRSTRFAGAELNS